MFSLKNKTDDKKIFLIINSYFMGDILLANPLAQNIKKIYDDSYIIMLAPPNLADVAKYQKDIDEVIIWDRHGEHKGFLNLLKFIWNFPYKHIYTAFPMYSADRSIILAKLLGSKYILGKRKNILGLLIKSKYKIIYNIFEDIQGKSISLLSGITKKQLVDYPIKLKMPECNSETVLSLIKSGKDYITLCPTSSNVVKDMPIDDVCQIIENINTNVVLLGKGTVSRNLSEYLEQKNYKNLIDLTNKTNYPELIQIISSSKACISVDTGSLHLACALDIPTVGVFYNRHNWNYKPSSNIYKNSFCDSDLKPDEIIENLRLLISKKSQ